MWHTPSNYPFVDQRAAAVTGATETASNGGPASTTPFPPSSARSSPCGPKCCCQLFDTLVMADRIRDVLLCEPSGPPGSAKSVCDSVLLKPEIEMMCPSLRLRGGEPACGSSSWCRSQSWPRPRCDVAGDAITGMTTGRVASLIKLSALRFATLSEESFSGV